jgi:pimeloyl-ACP methyl ester carboxylesterase
MWRDFPAKLSEATGLGAMVYSRFGYGQSSPVELPRPIRYMHDEALDVLPKVLEAANIGDTILFGHSDGGSIALIYAGGTLARPLRGLILEAAHVFCEDISVESIAAAAEAYRTTDLKDKLARYHGGNVDGAFWGWNRAWLDPEFHNWNLEEYLPSVGVPTLAIQGWDDQYGTEKQVETIIDQVPDSRALMLPECGHSPHREQEEAVLEAAAAFIEERLVVKR